tara:strand:+ start:363 stop:905 length:543 start_codon:yes stop_codon:yes gene_type:complete
MKKRRCPTCNKELLYKNGSLYNRAVKNGKGCRPCGQKNSGYDVWNKGKVGLQANPLFSKLNKKRKNKTYEEIYGKERANEIKQKQYRGKDNWPNYNKKSIPIIEKYGKDNGYNFQHAENGGEVMVISKNGNAYYVDGYDKKNNVVVEYYEKFHTRQKEYDKIRQREITERLACEFNIIWE